MLNGMDNDLVDHSVHHPLSVFCCALCTLRKDFINSYAIHDKAQPGAADITRAQHPRKKGATLSFGFILRTFQYASRTPPIWLAFGLQPESTTGYFQYKSISGKWVDYLCTSQSIDRI